jgi:hypothetical protein
MKRIFLLFITMLLLMACENLDHYPEQKLVICQADGVVFDVSIKEENGRSQTYNNQLGTFKKAFWIEEETEIWMIITNKGSGDVVGYIYKDGNLDFTDTDPAYIEIIHTVTY